MSGPPGRDLGLLVPAYQAAAHLEATIERIPAAVLERTLVLWIVDDGSRDGTREAALRVAARLPAARVHSFPENRGYGAAVLEGIRRVRADGASLAVDLHADGQYAPESIPDLLRALDGGLDLVQGSRHAAGTARAGGMPLYKRVAGRALTALHNAVFGLRMTDYHSGMLGFGPRALESIPFERLSGSFDFDLEAIACARALGLAVGEVPIPTRYADEVSHLNPVTYGLRCLRVTARYATGRYARLARERATSATS
jgi:glycosyltransferase involved in cell wall biosynthesis